MFEGFRLSDRFNLFTALSASGRSRLVLAGSRYEAIGQMVKMEALSLEQAMLLRVASHTTPIVIIDAPPLPMAYRGILHNSAFQDMIQAILGKKRAELLGSQSGFPLALGSSVILVTLALDWIVASYRFGTITAGELEVIKDLLLSSPMPSGIPKPTTATIIGRFHQISKQPESFSM